MYCMHCGEKIPDNSRFCKYCGKLVAEDEINTVNRVNSEVAEISSSENTTYEKAGADDNENTIDEVAGTSDNENTADERDDVNDNENNTGESSADELLNNALKRTENEPEIEIVDDYLFEHITTGRKIALFIGAVLITAIIAVIVFACFFPELI